MNIVPVQRRFCPDRRDLDGRLRRQRDGLERNQSCQSSEGGPSGAHYSIGSEGLLFRLRCKSGGRLRCGKLEKSNFSQQTMRCPEKTQYCTAGFQFYKYGLNYVTTYVIIPTYFLFCQIQYC